MSASPPPAVAQTDPGQMAPEARLAELAHLFARGALRATQGHTARLAREAADLPANGRESADFAARKGLDVLGGPAPACGHARAAGASRPRLAESLPEAA